MIVVKADHSDSPIIPTTTGAWIMSTVSLTKSDFAIVVRFTGRGRTLSYVRDVDTAVAQGMAYVWGWSDAGSPMPILPDGNRSVAWEFGWHFGRLAVDGFTRSVGRPSVQDAWARWSGQYPQTTARRR